MQHARGEANGDDHLKPASGDVANEPLASAAHLRHVNVGVLVPATA
jgi:hypothetical protein